MDRLRLQAETVQSLLDSINASLKKHLIKEIGDGSYTLPQIMLMRELHISPGLSVGELSARMGLAKSTVSGIVDRLEKQGAVSKTRDTDDRRLVKIELTEKSIDLKKMLIHVKTGFFQEILGKLDKNDIAGIVAAMSLLEKIMSQEEG